MLSIFENRVKIDIIGIINNIQKLLSEDKVL